MKKCLITGAAGSVGLKLITKLLQEEAYEITAIDLKSPKAQKKLNKFKNKINIVYADINDEAIINALVKDHDIIFHLAGILPPMSEMHSSLANIVDYSGSKNIIDAIKELNPKAYLIFPSTTALYGDNKEIVNVDSEVNILSKDIYSQIKLKIEDYIKNNISNYTIYRIPLILEKGNLDNIMYNIKIDTNMEIITNTLVANALVKTIKNQKKLNKKTYILSGGEKYQTTSNELFIHILKVKGISARYLLMRHFIPQNFYSHYYEDSNKLNEILDFQKGSINDVYKSYDRLKKFLRCFNRLLAYYSIRKLSKGKKD